MHRAITAPAAGVGQSAAVELLAEWLVQCLAGWRVKTVCQPHEKY